MIEVRNSNPNGDPDRESDPRTRAHDGRGMISDVSFKRKLRELILRKDGPVWTHLRSAMSLHDDYGYDGAKLLDDLKQTFAGKFKHFGDLCDPDFVNQVFPRQANG